ncbi:MAG: tetratricopeptide repeat protein, partial [Myxococcales bacterium]
SSPPAAAPQAAPFSSPLPSPAPVSNPDADFLDAPPANLGGDVFDFGSAPGGEVALELDRPEPAKSPDSAAKPAPALAKPAAPRAPKSAAPAPARSSTVDPARVLPQPKLVEQRSGGAWKVVVALALLVVVGAGAGLWIAKPALLFKPKEPPKPKILPEIESRLLAWKMALPGLSGASEEHLKRGIELFREDRHTSYIEAQEKFKAAVVLDPQNLEAVARYVEAFAVGRGEPVSGDRLEEARDLLFAVLRAQPKLAAAHRAQANLLLSTGQDDLARAEAEEAYNLSTDAERPEALLAWGRTYLKKSAPIAQEKFEEALQKDSSLKRALYYRGLAAEYAGDFAKAIAGYQERLKLDPDHRDTLRALARVLVRVGDHEAARKALADYSARYPDIGEPKVMSAQFAYMAQNDVRGAERVLRGLERELDLFDDSEKLHYHVLWSAIARERGDLKAAVSHAEEALKIAPDSGPAHFQAMLAALKSGQVDSAREHLRACEQGLGDAARFQEYRARVELAASQLDGAISAFRKASELAPTQLTPRLCAAALLARRGDENGAWSVLRRMLDLEPSSVARKRRPVSDYYEPELETARHAAGAFGGKAKDEDRWIRDIYAAIVDYHLGEIDGPARVLDRGLQIDTTSLPALIYRAQIELDRNRPKAALVFAKRASAADRENAVSNYLIARSLEAQGRDSDARTAYLEALDKNPRLTPANIRLALLLARSGSKDEAKARLLAVVSDEPENLEARVALFKLGY